MSAEQKLPTYVERIAPNGSNVYKPQFIAGVVSDVQSGTRTIKSIVAEFKIPYHTVRNWCHQHGGLGKGRMRAPRGSGARYEKRRKNRAVNGSATTLPRGRLIDQALALMPAQPQQRDAADQRLHEELELAMAYIQGRVSEDQVKRVLDRASNTRFGFTAWVGRVLSWAVKHHHLTPTLTRST